MLAFTILAFSLSLTPQDLFHPGGKDASGCHTNRKTGDRHCYGGGTAPKTSTARKHPTRAQSLRSTTALYASCDDVRAAGAAPLRRGDPGYSGRLDRDGDGVACEAGPGGVGGASVSPRTTSPSKTRSTVTRATSSARPSGSATSGQSAPGVRVQPLYTPATSNAPITPVRPRNMDRHHIQSDTDTP